MAPAAALGAEAPVRWWGFVDARGVAHLSPEPLDSRYAPLLREPGHETGRVAGKTADRHSLLTWLEFAPEVKVLQPVLREAARATGVDAELLKAIIAVESGYRQGLVSPRGAIGLMQITPVTADRYATPQERQRPAEERLLEPRTNVLTGARMLADLSRRLGGIDLALAAWNAGEGRVRRAGGRLPDIDETRAHVHLVLELYWALLQQTQHRQARSLNLAPAAR
ncbi:lytic transglycosylase domain-containing protein [Ideonella sp. TBM-1]|uniref:Lytic transglycosylase domain-containing protein n=2 Tax=Ideonella livida TaxID=2707176 RepID=A0A7C9PEP1_9BURK|nr:lytic transglycosylase domain-containing protein [Ideonella livida]